MRMYTYKKVSKTNQRDLYIHLQWVLAMLYTCFSSNLVRLVLQYSDSMLLYYMACIQLTHARYSVSHDKHARVADVQICMMEDYRFGFCIMLPMRTASNTSWLHSTYGLSSSSSIPIFIHFSRIICCGQIEAQKNIHS